MIPIYIYSIDLKFPDAKIICVPLIELFNNWNLMLRNSNSNEMVLFPSLFHTRL